MQKNRTKFVSLIVLAVTILLQLSISAHAGYRIEYEYDSLDRLIKVTHPNNKTVNYVYDAVGNRIRKFVTTEQLTPDIDHSGRVDFIDFAFFANQWLENCAGPGWCQGCDFNESGKVDVVDLKTFAEKWLWEKMPADNDGDNDVDFNDLMKLTKHWLDTCVEPIWCEGCDINQSGSVNWIDFALLAENWLEGTTP